MCPGPDQRAELWSVREHADGYVQQLGAGVFTWMQSLTGQHPAGHQGHPRIRAAASVQETTRILHSNKNKNALHWKKKNTSHNFYSSMFLLVPPFALIYFLWVAWLLYRSFVCYIIATYYYYLYYLSHFNIIYLFITITIGLFIYLIHFFFAATSKCKAYLTYCDFNLFAFVVQ